MRRWLGFFAFIAVMNQKLSAAVLPVLACFILTGVVFFNLGIFNRFPDWHLTILSGSSTHDRRTSLLEALNKGYYRLASTLAQGDMELIALSKTPDQLNTELRWWESLYSLQPNAQPVLRSLSILQKAYGKSERANELLLKSVWLRPEPQTKAK